jgi:hypothetical protein
MDSLLYRAQREYQAKLHVAYPASSCAHFYTGKASNILVGMVAFTAGAHYILQKPLSFVLYFGNVGTRGHAVA